MPIISNDLAAHPHFQDGIILLLGGIISAWLLPKNNARLSAFMVALAVALAASGCVFSESQEPISPTPVISIFE